MTDIPLSWRRLALLALLGVAAGAAAAQARSGPRNGDYIVAIINQELVTAGEVDQRVERARQNAARSGAAGRLPAADELRRLVLESLIDERVIVTHARDSGIRIDDPEVDRAVQSVAAQNQIGVDQLRAGPEGLLGWQDLVLITLCIRGEKQRAQQQAGADEGNKGIHGVSLLSCPTHCR